MSFETNNLKSMCDLIVDCPHSTPKWTDSGVIVLRNQNIRNGRLDLSDPSYTDEIHYQQRVRRAAPQPFDIVITREAPMGEVCLIPIGVRCCLGQRQVLLRPKKDIESVYLLYALQSFYVQNQISWSEGTGSTVSNLRIPLLEELRIPRHMGSEKKIASILSSLDDKIELNRQMNKTLEEMARAIFKSWFVDFEPVKAKIEAKKKKGDHLRAAMMAISGKSGAEIDKMPAKNRKELEQTAALFPDELVESELGMIPKGWEVKPLSKTVRIIGGGTPKRSEESYWKGSIPWFSVRDVPDDGNVYVINTEEHISEIGLNNSSAKILPIGTTIVTARGTVGKIALVGTDMAMNQSCYGLSPLTESSEIFNYFRIETTVGELKQKTHGAVFDTITTTTFDSVKTIEPTSSMKIGFNDTVIPILERIKSGLKEINSLTQIRDSLLPRLLSGEIEVSATRNSE